jgi:hypothetical protein
MTKEAEIQKVPEGGVPMAADAPQSPVGEDAPVWEGGDPGEGDPTPRAPESVETTYWPKGAESPEAEEPVPAPIKSKGKHSADPLTE